LHMAGVLAQQTLFVLAVKLWQQEHCMNGEWQISFSLLEPLPTMTVTSELPL
jgi:hypothetical protein